MIQFNLLPEVKLEYIKARRSKRLVILSSAIVTGIALAIMVGLFMGTNVLQKGRLNDLKKDIDSASKKLQDEPDLNKILTIQNQLTTLNDLHDKKPAAERLRQYMSQATPVEVSMSSLKVDFVANTVTIDGGSGSIKSINKFVDTLKFTSYSVDGQDSGQPFKKVVLAAFTRVDQEGQGGTQPPATYQITFEFEPAIFDISKDVKLNVPAQVTTRSTTEKPTTPLFQPANTGEDQ